MSRLLLIIASVIFAYLPYAVGQTFVNQIEGTPLTVQEVFTVQDVLLEGPDAHQSEPPSIDNRIVFEVLRNGQDPVEVGAYTITIEVRFWKIGDAYHNSATRSKIYELTVDANSAGGKTPLLAPAFQDSRRMEIEIRNLTFNGDPTLPQPSPRMRLMGEVSIPPVPCGLDVTAIPQETFFTNSPYPDSVAMVSFIDCADEYDFEYTFYDSDSREGQLLSSPGGTTLTLDDLFRNNATRLTSTSQFFRIFGLYREGYVIGRYRGVSYENGLRIYTPWSSYGKQAWEGTTLNPAIIEVGHQSEYNWKATTNFAEDAKQLPAVSYLDGTMRGRQNLVLQYGETNGPPDPRTEFVIGQQTIYDAMGRPAVSVLPAPIYPERTADHPLKFDESVLARPLGEPEQGPYRVYGKQEVESTEECSAEPMSPYAGAGRFYSRENDRIDSTNAFVPNGEGYPFAVTRYTPDNTGRVRTQGGVGPRLQVGEHDTRYFYGKPNQWELDRLFGVNVGRASHYQKTMVIDPNGQATVSYLDAKGRTVATALAGQSPPNLIPIKQVQAGFGFTVDASDTTGRTFIFNNTSLAATSYKWKFAELDSTTEQSPVYTFPETGTYVVCLTATDSEGLVSDQTCQYVRATPQPRMVRDTIILQPGLNLVGLDVAPRDARPASVFASVIADNNLLYVQGRDTLGGLELYIPEISEEDNVLKALQVGRGYMVGVEQLDTLVVEGIAVDTTFRPTLYPGVNLLTYLPRLRTTPADFLSFLTPGTLEFARGYAGRFYTYRPNLDPAGQPFLPTNGQAYEIVVTERVPGQTWTDPYTEEYFDSIGANEGFELYDVGIDTTALNRSILSIQDENDYTLGGPSESAPPLTGNAVEVSILNNVRYGDRVESSFSLLVAANGYYDICYALEEAESYSECCSTPEDCFDCYYDITVEISASSLCSDEVSGFTSLPVVFQRNSVRSSGDYSGDCFAGSELDMSNLLLGVGEYHITKSVRLSESRIDSARQKFLADGSCVQASEEFTAAYIAQIDTSGCYECDCSLPAGMQPDSCADFCTYLSPCDVLLIQMRSDVQPTGQYARYVVQTNSLGDVLGYTADPNSPLSIFTTDPATSKPFFAGLDWDGETVLVDGDNLMVENLTVQQFVENFDTAWVGVLLEYHPERGLLDFCQERVDFTNQSSLVSSYAFDDLLRGIHTYQSASSALGFSSSASLMSSADIKSALDRLVANDAFFVPNTNSSLESEFKAALYGHTGAPQNNLDNILPRQLNALFSSDPTGQNNWVWPTTDPAQAYQRDIAWQMLRDLYLSRKSTFIEQQQYAYGQNNSTAIHGTKWQCLDQPACQGFPCSTPSGCSAADQDIYGQYTARVVFTTQTEVVQAGVPSSVDQLLNEEPYIGLQGQLRKTENERCESACADYVPIWQEQLRGCSGIDSTDIPIIIDELLAICATGCGSGTGGQPRAVSSVPEGIPSPGAYRTFVEVVTAYFNDSVCITGDCNPYLISTPAPSEYDEYAGTLTIGSAQVPMWLSLNRTFLESRWDYLLEDCACSECEAPSVSTTYLSTDQIAAMAALNRMPVSRLEQTLSVISDFIEGQTAGLFPTQDLVIPAEFNPAGRFCATRDELLQELGSSPSAVCGGDSVDVAALQAQQLNAAFGWSRTWVDYARLIDSSQTCLICADPAAEIPPLSAPVDDCRQELLTRAEEEAGFYYTQYTAALVDSFELALRRQCLEGITDKLRMRYVPYTYHYTLYYYDQAGNLALTVPPHGVAPLMDPANDSVAVSQYRAAITESLPPSGALTTILPQHQLLTHYRYNSFNEVTLSDAPDRDVAETWYDALGRPVLSRDGRQDSLERASYTLYDNLGRPVEVGELAGVTATTLSERVGSARSGGLSAFFGGAARYGVTRTYYTESPLTSLPVATQELTLRNRVAATTYAEQLSPSQGADDDYAFASHYGYDIAGNVSQLIQEFVELEDLAQRFKTLEYTYDLISGNVHYLHYQRGQADQFSYYYTYDKLNRLSEAFSSEIETNYTGSNLWKREAAYQYYDHGPLRRTVLGQDRLQGLDYAYTLQGWIKGLNGSLGDDYQETSRQDMNMDGFRNEPGYVLDWVDNRDIYRWANQYFHGDYEPIGGGLYSPFDADLPPDHELFNGNIVRHYKSTVVDSFRTAALVGEYDQLNRVRYGNQVFYGQETRPEEIVSPAYAHLLKAVEAPAYDGAGNVRYLDRWYRAGDGSGTVSGAHNRLNYGYRPGTNLLTSVQASRAGSAPTETYQPFPFLDGEYAYAYDRSGNLVQEINPDQQSRIDWNAYGKVTEVAITPGEQNTEGAGSLTRFAYGPDQQRWVKWRFTGQDGGVGEPENATTTYYVRDAQGSVLSTYAREQAYNTASGNYTDVNPFTLATNYLYGSSRLGEVVRNLPLTQGNTPADAFGLRRYELTNHLGNVVSTFGEEVVDYTDITDRTYRVPAVVSHRDYFAFGMELNRQGEANHAGQGSARLQLDDYRYAFNGKEIDSDGEWGSGTTAYDYGFRIYNPQLGRFLSVDPLSPDYPELTPYQFASNTPIAAIDVDGLEMQWINDIVDWFKSALDNKKKSWEDRIAHGTRRAKSGYEGSNHAINNSLPLSQDFKDLLHSVEFNSGVAEIMGVHLEPTREVIGLMHSSASVMNSMFDAAIAADEGEYASMSASLVFIPLDVMTFGKGSKAFSFAGDKIAGQIGRNADEIAGTFKAESSDYAVEFLGNVDLKDGVMTVSELAIYPVGAVANEAKNEVGTRNVVSLLRTLEEYARKEGASELRITGTRVANSSSANPGHTADIVRKLD
ncbi:RHS repeat-associated core domain-containing protein [Lewinella sp. IMCC34191]|uniref:RHS repeat-associated core domain-containing protein n=1 Tax=Lewinella sp. IMCC34191 TaxID=2259172 RepID=UPI000E28506A|nr:RHS repeat-associated core domain-containing protein [Lewinella sp. IMCC34191]